MKIFVGGQKIIPHMHVSGGGLKCLLPYISACIMPQNLKILQNYFKIVFSKKIILIFEKIFELNIKLI